VEEANSSPRTFLIGLAGQPNVGKSTIFNLLTGLSQHVGNWPGKTVERKEGTFARDGVRLRIVDLPGTYSLSAGSAEERVARDFILLEHPDVVVMVADASSIERNLYLLAELLALPAPVVLGLNMMDVAEAQDIRLEPSVLEAALRLPVVPLVAVRNEGLAELAAVVERVARNPSSYRPTRPEIREAHREVLGRLRALLDGSVPKPYSEQWVALKLLEGDTEITEKAHAWLAQPLWNEVHTLLSAHEDAVLDIAGGRYEWIGRMVRAAVTRPRLGRISLTDRLDRVAVHPLWGLLLLFAVLGVVFWITFTAGGRMQAWLEIHVVGGLQAAVGGTLAQAPWWLSSLLVDGVLGGAGVVVTFLPILIVFFGSLGLLEDSGYLSRAAYVMDRFMHALGLHGKSFLPLFLGFGCNVPAVMGTRVIETQSGRLLTILLAPLVPCTARLQVLAVLTPVFFGSLAVFVSAGLVAVNLLVLAVMGIMLNRTLFRGRRMALIMELPLYHVPNLRTIGLFVWHNTWAFLRKATTVILVVSVLIWALGHFPGPDVEHSLLAQFGRALAPAARLMGMDWRMVVALLASFVAKENAIAALGVLYGEGPVHAGLTSTLAAAVTPAAGLAFLAVTMLFIPCAATLAVMRQELRAWRWTLASVALLLVIALTAGVVAYQSAILLGMGGSRTG
jgi:ferrous iron transport protein B